MCHVKVHALWASASRQTGVRNQVRCQQTRKCSRNQTRPLSKGTSKAILVSRLSPQGLCLRSFGLPCTH